MEVTANGNGKLVVYWDGQCPFCSAIKQRFSALDTTHRLNFVDMNDPAVAETAAPRFTPAELTEEMRVKMPDGTWRTGFFAWAAVLRTLPLLRWLGILMQSWLLADIGPKAYRWTADHRYAISRLLRLPAPCAPDGSCRIA